ncbi:unnamed protein product [Rhizopus stolonifer]
MALRLISKKAASAAFVRPSLMNASRQSLGVSAVRHYTTQKEVEPREKASSIINNLPGNSFVSKTGFLTLGTGLATFLISKEIYVLNEETLVLVASTGLLGVLLKYLREPFSNMADEHIARIKNVMVKAREDHKAAVQERIDEAGQMKDLVDVTKALFELSRETAKLEAEAFTLKQQVAVASEAKTTLDSWVRHEASLREREQKQLAAYLIEKINKDLNDPKIQQQILDQAILDLKNVFKCQLKSFKKSQTASTEVSVKRAGQAPPPPANDLKRAFGFISNNTKASFDGAKRKKKSTVYSQPANTGTGQHAMSQLYTVIQFLKDNDHPQFVVSIASRTKVDIAKNPALWEKLVHNEKIEYDSVNNVFSYKPTYQIKSKEDLLTLLVTKKKEGGMDYKDLKDSYSKLGSAVEELAGEGVILVVRNKDGNPRVLFYNEAQYNTSIDADFKKMWSEISIPDETDLPKALEEAGLKTMEVFEKKITSEVKKKAVRITAI